MNTRFKDPVVEEHLNTLKLRREGIKACFNQHRVLQDAEYVEFQPGNGTRYLCVFTFLDDREVRNNFKYYSGSDIVFSLVTRTKGSAVSFSSLHLPSWQYLMDKLDIYDGDAFVLEELINHIVSERDSRVKKEGK